MNQVRLSEAIRDAARQAIEDKDHFFEMVMADDDFDPELSTHQDALIFMLRDLFYNAVDAGTRHVSVNIKRPSLEANLPYLDDFNFEIFPSLYLLIENDGRIISSAKCSQLNAYLNNENVDESVLSTKNSGGLGTKNLREFLYLHKGRCRYESANDCSRVHIYFERLEI